MNENSENFSDYVKKIQLGNIEIIYIGLIYYDHIHYTVTLTVS